MSTVQDIIVAAMARDARLRGEWLTTYATELTAVVHRAQQAAFLLGTQRNPSYWSTRVTMAASSGAWARPTDANMVYRLRYLAEPVAVVAEEDEADLGAGRLAVYEEGQSYYPCTGGLLAGTEQLTARVSEAPATLTTTSQALDTRWPTRFNDLLILPVFQYLQVKDGRPDVAQLAGAELEEWRTLFTAWLTSLTVDVERIRMEPATQPTSRRGTVRGADHA